MSSPQRWFKGLLARPVNALRTRILDTWLATLLFRFMVTWFFLRRKLENGCHPSTVLFVGGFMQMSSLLTVTALLIRPRFPALNVFFLEHREVLFSSTQLVLLVSSFILNMSTPNKEPQNLKLQVLYITIYGFLFQGVKGTRRAQLALEYILVSLSHSMSGDVRPLILVVVLNPMLFLIPAVRSYIKTNNLEGLGIDAEPSQPQSPTSLDDSNQQASRDVNGDLLRQHHFLHDQQVAIGQAQAGAEEHFNLSEQSALINQQPVRSASEIEQALDVSIGSKQLRAQNKLTHRSHFRVQNDCPNSVVSRSRTLTPTWIPESGERIANDDPGRSLSAPAQAGRGLPAEPSGVLIGAANHMQTEWMMSRLHAYHQVAALPAPFNKHDHERNYSDQHERSCL